MPGRSIYIIETVQQAGSSTMTVYSCHKLSSSSHDSSDCQSKDKMLPKVQLCENKSRSFPTLSKDYRRSYVNSWVCKLRLDWTKSNVLFV